jgi:acyl dehydratase
MSTESNYLTDEMREQAIGTQGEPAVLAVEKGAVERFAEAISDPNPLWNDEATARKGRYGGLVAPPTFLRSVRFRYPQLPFDIPFDRLLDGGSEWEYFEPVRVGDRITAVARIADVSERPGRLGTMLFTVTEVTYTNQLNETVATQRSVSIWY